MLQHEPRARTRPPHARNRSIAIGIGILLVAWSTLSSGTSLTLAATTTFVATADAHVKSTSPTTNYGTATTLQVRAPSPEYRTYLRFAVSRHERSVHSGNAPPLRHGRQPGRWAGLRGHGDVG